MKKFILSCAVVMLTICSFMTVAACSSGGGDESESIARVFKDSPSVNVWTTSALSKVVKQGEFSDNICDYGKGKDIRIDMARNEYESAQIIISATDDVKEYSVFVTDLVDGNGNRIPKEAIEFFHQKYVKIEKKTVPSSPYVLGEYPEALLPLGKAIEYGENTVQAGYNQGIWLTVKTEHETVSGTYTGNITVQVTKDTYNVPIKINVWDIDVSDDMHCMYISNYSTVMAFTNEGDATQERMEKANDFLLKNFRVINETLATDLNDYDSFVRNLVKYKNYSGYYTFLPFEYNPYSNGLIDWDVTAMRTVLMKIIDQSVKDNFSYADMVWFYPYWYDEWQFKVSGTDEEIHEYLSNIRDEGLFFRSLCAEVVSVYDKCYGSDRIDSVAGLRESILNIKTMISGEYSEISAPYFESYDVLVVSNWQLNQEERPYIESIKEKGFDFCAYNCNWPRYPRLAGHIDSSLVEIRIFGWQMYDFDSMGILYHRLSSDGSFVNLYKNINDTMVRFTANGDGLLIYPGAYYGMDIPVASTRLHAIRDSLEDYEYLYNLEQAYATLSDYYEIEISAEKFLDTLYYTLYADNPDYKPNRDVNTFYQIREQVFKSIIAAQSEEKMILESKYDTADTTVVKMLFSAECDLHEISSNPYFKVRENAGTGYRYVFEFPKNEENHSLEITYILNGKTKTYTMAVNRGSVVIDTLESNENGIISATDNVEISSVEYQSKMMTKIVFTSVITGDETKDTTYLSQALLDVETLLEYVDVAAGYSIDVYNPTDKEISINLYYETAILDKPIEAVSIEANGYKTLTLYNLDDLKKASNIIIRMPNTGTSDNPDVYQLLISNLKYIKGAE